MKAISKFAIPLILIGAVVVPAPAKASPKYFCPEWHSLLRRHKLPVEIFDKIMWRESRCEPRAIGWNYKRGMSHKDCRLAPANTYRKCRAVRSYDSGLLQINSSWRTLTAQVCRAEYGDLTVLLNPDCNLRMAARLYAGGTGLNNWKSTSGRK